MMLGIGTETVIFIYAGLTGIIIFLVYQILRLFRRLVRHHYIVTGIEDFFFWLGASAYIFRQMYYTTYGSIRWFFVLGIVFGCALAGILLSILKKISGKRKKELEKKGKNR